MPVVQIDDIEVHFPFEPYKLQVDLMTKVIECLQTRSNGLLESPTGTGKTLSLLCASLAWQRKMKSTVNSNVSLGAVANRLANHPSSRPTDSFPNQWNSSNRNQAVPPPISEFPKIIYCSRTHSQLSQAIQELKRSFYRNTKAIVLGSRDVMCIHDQVSRLETSAAKITACHIRVKAHTCVYYNNVQQRKDDPLLREQPVVDIEDLVAKGKKYRACPFFLSRELVQEAEVVFMPYNYVLDPKLRSTHGIDLYNSVVILDEGHNIAKVCEESLSFEIKSSSIALCIQELTKGLNDFNDTTQQLASSGNALLKDLTMGGLIGLKQSFLALEAELNKIETKPDGILLPGSTLLSILFNNGFPPSALPRMVTELEALSTFLAGNNYETTGCNTFASILRVLSSPSMQRNPALFGDSYKVFVELEESKKAKQMDLKSYVSLKSSQAKVFSFWCFNPAVGLSQMVIHGPRCIMLSSGTLSPMSFLAKELQLPFPVQLSNPHIIQDGQLFATVVKTGPNNIKLSSSYQNRNNPNYLQSLGDLIAKVCSVVPKGVLVFFPSYSVMDVCSKAWQQSGQWERISRCKKVLMEPRGKHAFKQMMDEYYEAVKTPNGGVLMAVCRGKVSEGLDFTDDNGRAVIITGIPYSPAMDPQVKAKQQYLNSKMLPGTEGINGNQWYQLEATRALNQAMGRIIRHSQDFGAILLCDERCDQTQFTQNLPKWVKDRMRKFSEFNDVINDLAKFFGAAVPRALKLQAEIRGVTISRARALKSSQNNELATQNDKTPSELKDLYKSGIKHIDKKTVEIKQTEEHIPNCSQLFHHLESSTGEKPDFNSPLPIYLKSFPAFSKSSSPSTQGNCEIQKRKRIRLMKAPIKIQLEPEVIADQLPRTGSVDHDESKPKFSIFDSKSENLTSQLVTKSNSSPETKKCIATASGSSITFKTIPEFWQWTKNVLESNGVTIFASLLKSYKKDKNIVLLKREIHKLFTKDKINCVIQGLKLVMPASQAELLK